MNLTVAQAALERALEEAQKLPFPMSIAIVDAGGHLVTAARGDGAGYITLEMAVSKAWTSAGSGLPTAHVLEALKDYPHLLAGGAASTKTRFLAIPGAVPIKLDGKLIGAIGVSGGDAEQDLQVAEAGAAAGAAAGAVS